jgi:plasmid stability protein
MSENTCKMVKMNEDLHYQLKIRAANEGRTMRDIVEDLVADYLDLVEKNQTVNVGD